MQLFGLRQYSSTANDPVSLEIHIRYAFDSASRLTSITPASTIAAYAIAYDRSNRYLHGDEIDRVLADEQYANDTVPGYSATTASAVLGYRR